MPLKIKGDVPKPKKRRSPHELVGFLAAWAVKYADDYELNGLHPTHYDLLAKYGARMDDFKRATNAQLGD